MIIRGDEPIGDRKGDPGNRWETTIHSPSMDPRMLLHLILYSFSSVFGCVPTRPTSTPSPSIGRYPPVFHHALTYLPLDDLPLWNGSIISRENETEKQEVSAHLSGPSDTMTQSLLTALSSVNRREGETPSDTTLRTLMQWLYSLAPRQHNLTSNNTVINTATVPPSTHDTTPKGMTNATTVTPTTTTVPPGMNTTTVTSTTTTATPTTTTTVAPTDCCPMLNQTRGAPTEFPDGDMSFTYNNNVCRSTVSAFCSQTDPAFNLYAAIVANGDNFLDYQPTNVTFPGTCRGGTWFMGNPPLAITTLECRLTNPPANP